MKDNELKIIDGNDLAGLLSAALSPSIDNATAAQIDEIKAVQLAKWGIVEFTEKELNTMPKSFKKLLLLQGRRCRLRTHASGKNTTQTANLDKHRLENFLKL